MVRLRIRAAQPYRFGTEPSTKNLQQPFHVADGKVVVEHMAADVQLLRTSKLTASSQLHGSIIDMEADSGKLRDKSLAATLAVAAACVQRECACARARTDVHTHTH